MLAQKVFDYIIVGQGLAGSLLAHQLIQLDQKVLVIDNNHFQSSSQVAAGIINPLTGPRLALTEDFEMYYPTAKRCYTHLEQVLNVKLWQELEQHRMIKDQAQHGYYQKRLNDACYKNYIGNKIDSPYFYGAKTSIDIYRSAAIDTKSLILETRKWLDTFAHLNSIRLDYSEIKPSENQLTIGKFRTRRIVFCEGFQAIHNPWLRHLPFKLSKGEVLTIDTTQTIKVLLNWGHWLAPIQRKIKLGSNYVWDDLSLQTSNDVEQELLKSLHESTRIAGHVSEHEVGIRPTTKQRKPFIGPLKNLNGAYCFNGFGSKGCLLIPYYANLFCQHLINDAPLDSNLTQWL